jgi:plastocyanin
VVRIIKSSATSTTVPAQVKITAVDQTTQVITFDTNITIQAGDTITYLYTDAFGCQNNTKTVNK